MNRLTIILCLMGFIFIGQEAFAQDEVEAGSPIDGEWVTETGTLVDVSVNGTEVRLDFPETALTRWAKYNNGTLIYTTYYRDTEKEEIYLSCPESERASCERFVKREDPRHRFTLVLSEDGMVLSGIKEINVMVCEWDTDENGYTSNHRPVGFEWTYFSEYQWRRANCDFTGFPPLNSNIMQKYDLVKMMFDNFGIDQEFSLGDFNVRDRIKFDYQQNYIDENTGEFVSSNTASALTHLEPLDGMVYLDDESGVYMIELYPYALESYVNLLTGITILSHQLNAVQTAGGGMIEPDTQMQLDSVSYAWSHRSILCSHTGDSFDHHVDFLSRALAYRKLREDRSAQ